MTDSLPLQLLTALWTLWQSLAADGGERLREECGLDLREFIAAGYLSERPYQPTELSAVMQMPRYEVSRLLGSLEARGFVQRSRHQQDGRQVVVALTPAGISAWQCGLATAEQVTERYLTRLDDEKRRDLILTIAGLVRP